MSALLFVLAFAALAAGVWLWVTDSRPAAFPTEVGGRAVRFSEVGGAPQIAVSTGTTCAGRVDLRRAPELFLIDDRVRTAFATLPPSVESLWCEGEWVVAEMAPGTPRTDCEAALEPLGLLADAAHILPPAAPEPTSSVPARVEPEPVAPAVRPAEPLEMPTRVTGAQVGQLQDRGADGDLGGDSVAPIADGSRGGTRGGESVVDLTRVRRKANKPPSIFDTNSTKNSTTKEP